MYITAVAGLVVSLSAAAALWNGVDNKPTHQVVTGPASRPAAAKIGQYTQTEHQVVFYLVSSDVQAAKAQEYEDLAQWVRYGIGVPEPSRSINVLQAASAQQEASALLLIDQTMAAVNFTSGQEAPTFQVVDLRNQ